MLEMFCTSTQQCHYAVWTQIATKSPCISFMSNSLITPNVLSHDDLKKFESIDKPDKQNKASQKCQACKDEEWKCKLNPCEVWRKRISNSLTAQQTCYQSYNYGSNGIHNSYHQDTFLELTYYSFKRHFNCSPNIDLKEGLTALFDSFVLREQRKFHESKMT